MSALVDGDRVVRSRVRRRVAGAVSSGPLGAGGWPLISDHPLLDEHSDTDDLGIDWFLDAILSPLALVDRDMRLVAVNAAYCAAGGKARSELVGVVLFDAFPENPGANEDSGPVALRRSLERVFVAGESELMPLHRYDVQDITGGSFVERFWSITTSPVRRIAGGHVDYAFVHAEEVTSFLDERLRREADGQDARSAGQSGAIDTVFTVTLRRLHQLNELAAALLRSNSSAEVAHAFVQYGLVLLGATAGSFVMLDGDRFVLVESRNVSRAVLDGWQEFTVSPGQDPFSDAIVAGEPLFFASPAQLRETYPRLEDRASWPDHQAWAVLPLIESQKPIGAIGVIFDHPNPFTSPVRFALKTIGNLVTQAASRALLSVEQEQAIQSVNDILTARVDVIDGVHVETLYRPATQLTSAGGDWYDVIKFDAGMMFVIGDVANHGARASGEMARARATVQAYANAGYDPAAIATSASATLDHFSNTFTTAVIGWYDEKRRMLQWCNAGHPYPLLLTARGSAEYLAQTHGPPLGVGTAYAMSQRQLNAGDTIVLYTDGLIERRGEVIDEGLDRLRRAAETIVPASNTTADQLYRLLVPSMLHNDDIAILVLRFD